VCFSSGLFSPLAFSFMAAGGLGLFGIGVKCYASNREMKISKALRDFKSSSLKSNVIKHYEAPFSLFKSHQSSRSPEWSNESPQPSVPPWVIKSVVNYPLLYPSK